MHHSSSTWPKKCLSLLFLKVDCHYSLIFLIKILFVCELNVRILLLNDVICVTWITFINAGSKNCYHLQLQSGRFFFSFSCLSTDAENSHPFIYHHRQSHTLHAYYDLFIAALSSCSVVSCVISPHFVSTAEEILKYVFYLASLWATGVTFYLKTLINLMSFPITFKG